MYREVGILCKLRLTLMPPKNKLLLILLYLLSQNIVRKVENVIALLLAKKIYKKRQCHG